MCDQCDYQAPTQRNLTQHIQSRHEGVKYTCDQCEYQAKQQSNLTHHIQSKHEGVKYACDRCDYQATTQNNLARHMKSKLKCNLLYSKFLKSAKLTANLN